MDDKMFARRKYDTIVPIAAEMVNEKTRDEYVRRLRAGGARMVFLVSSAPVEELRPLTDREIADLRAQVEFFGQNGIETAIWTGCSIGHGGPLVPADEEERAARFRPLVTVGGEAVRTTRCPLDDDFRAALAQSVRGYIATGARTIVYDDDFRINQHAPEPCCCCEKHLARMQDLLGHAVTRDMVRAALRNKPNPVRTAFLQAQAEGLRLLAADLRAAADAVDPDVRLAVCSAWSPWDLDGADPIELSRMLAGKRPALLRLHGAPYWKDYWDNFPLAAIVETERMFASFCAGTDLEIVSEGDTWPRPRYRTASAPLEVFDAALRAAGTTDGILKYLFDYTTAPAFEPGYADRHEKDLPLLERIRVAFARAVPEGVRVCVYPHTLETADLPPDFDLSLLDRRPYASGYVLAAASVPAVYEGKGTGCALVLGENARHVDLSLLEKGGIVDAAAARILTERGLDLGIRKIDSFAKEPVAWERYPDGERIAFGRIRGAVLTVRLLRAAYAQGVTAESVAETGSGAVPLTYRYENAQGQKFFVLAFSAEEQELGSILFRHYARGRQMRAAAEWIAEKRLPATAEGEPDLLIITARRRNALVVGVFNCFEDSVLRPVIRLDRAYSALLRHVGAKARLDGDTVVLSELPAYGFACFTVE